jgi:hypothetical protein
MLMVTVANVKTSVLVSLALQSLLSPSPTLSTSTEIYLPQHFLGSTPWISQTSEWLSPKKHAPPLPVPICWPWFTDPYHVIFATMESLLGFPPHFLPCTMGCSLVSLVPSPYTTVYRLCSAHPTPLILQSLPGSTQTLPPQDFRCSPAEELGI